MGQITAINGGASRISVAHRQRFARHFPGLFAYVRAMSNGYGPGVDRVEKWLCGLLPVPVIPILPILVPWGTKSPQLK